MQHVRGKHKTPPGIQVERDAVRFKALEAELREARAKRKYPRCAYCNEELKNAWDWRWFYDEDGQRVRKCRDEASCRERRKKKGEEDSYRRAVVKFNRPGREKWVDFKREGEDGRDE